MRILIKVDAAKIYRNACRYDFSCEKKSRNRQKAPELRIFLLHVLLE